MRVTMVVADQGKPCGVRDYSEILCDAMPGTIDARVKPVRTPHQYTPRHHLARLVSARRRVLRDVGSPDDADLVHVQYSDFGWNGARAFEDCYDVFSCRSRTPMAITLHEHPWFRHDHTWDRAGTAAGRLFSIMSGHRKISSNILRNILLRHEVVHVNHIWQMRNLVDNGFPQSRIAVIPHFVAESGASTGDVEEFRRKFGLEGKQIMSMAGFIFDRKRHDRAIEVLPRLRDDVVLCLLGGSNDPATDTYCERLKEQARRLNVESRFLITGYLSEEEMNAGLAASELLVAPYGEVSSSGSICRGIGCHVPIVGGRTESFVEMKDLGAGMILVNADSTDQLSSAVMRVLEDENLGSDLRAANKRYSLNYSARRVAGLVGQMYDAVAGKGSATPEPKQNA